MVSKQHPPDCLRTVKGKIASYHGGIWHFTKRWNLASGAVEELATRCFLMWWMWSTHSITLEAFSANTLTLKYALRTNSQFTTGEKGKQSDHPKCETFYQKQNWSLQKVSVKGGGSVLKTVSTGNIQLQGARLDPGPQKIYYKRHFKENWRNLNINQITDYY